MKDFGMIKFFLKVLKDCGEVEEIIGKVLDCGSF